MKTKCKEFVYVGDWGRGHTCTRSAVKDGFCKQHHPDSVKARQIKADERYEEKKAKSPYGRLIIALEKIETIERETAEKCAEMAEIQQDKIKHTSHRDGLGMGCLCCEGELASIATDIRDHFKLSK